VYKHNDFLFHFDDKVFLLISKRNSFKFLTKDQTCEIFDIFLQIDYLNYYIKVF